MNKKIHITPYGKAEFPYLTHPDTVYDPDGKYKVKLRVPHEEAQSTIKLINDCVAQQIKKEHDKKPGTSIVKRAPLPFDYENNNTEVVFSFKMKARGINSETGKPFEQKPQIIDEQGNKFPENRSIWSGSILSVSYEPVGYSSSLGVGCTLRLKGVLVKELVEGDTATSVFSDLIKREEYPNGQNN